MLFADTFSFPAIGASVAATLLGIYLIPGIGRKILSVFRTQKYLRHDELQKVEDTLVEHGKELVRVRADIELVRTDISEIKELLIGTTDMANRTQEGLVAAVERVDDTQDALAATISQIGAKQTEIADAIDRLEGGRPHG